jgi:hypothetical protein
MERGNRPGGNPGPPGQPPAVPERALPRPPSTLTDISPAAIQAALRGDHNQAGAKPGAATPPSPPAKSGVAPTRADPGRVKVEPVALKTQAARPDDDVSLSRETMLAAALVVGVLGAALPAASLGWLVLALLVQGGASEILEHTGGLVPTTFGGGYWLSLGVNASVLLWCAVRRVRGRPAAWRPLVALIAMYVLALWSLVSIDVCRLADVPDVLTTFALLGADSLVQYMLPIALLVLLLQGVLYAWRAGRGSVRVAGRITAAAGCLGLAGLTAAAMLLVVGAVEPLSTLGAQASEVRLADMGGVESDRLRYERVAATVGAAGARPCR